MAMLLSRTRDTVVDARATAQLSTVARITPAAWFEAKGGACCSTKDCMEIPTSLRTWFVVHALLDVGCGIPLLLVPELVLPRLGWAAVDPVTTRLVAAALIAIGVQSWRGRNDGVASFRAMLGLKVVWSVMAIIGLTIAIARGAPPLTFLFLSIFLAFCGVWSHHAIRFRQLGHAAAAPETDDDAGDVAADGDVPPDAADQT